jgi:hypothetical protein
MIWGVTREKRVGLSLQAFSSFHSEKGFPLYPSRKLFPLEVS